MTEPRPTRAKLYRDANGGYRWRMRAGNGETIAASTEAYVMKADCIANYRRICGALAPELEEEEA